MESQAVKGIGKDYDATKERIISEFDKAKSKISEAQQSVESYIQDNPKKAAAMAVGVGAAIGAALTAYLMKEKSSDSKIVDEKETAIEQA